MKNHQLIVAFCFVGLGFFQIGCDDSSEGGAAVGEAGTRGLGSNGPIIPGTGTTPSADMGIGATLDMESAGGDALVAMECTPGERRCLEEGGSQEQECGRDGFWRTRMCVEGEVCSMGGCINSAVGCTPGETICLPNGNVAVCDNDQWIEQGGCAEGLSCRDGECVSTACVSSLSGRSYIGCDFLTLDLANSAFDLRDENGDGLPDGTTENSPTGLVVANNSDSLPLQLTLLGPNGMPTPLISSRVIEVPSDIDLPTAQYQDTTVTSNVRNAAGQIVTPEISRAENLDVPPGGIATLLLPRGRMDWTSSNIRKSAFRLQSTQPVVAYQFSPYCCNFSFSNDASLLFPTSSLGTNYRYVGAAHHQFFDIRTGSTPNEPAVMTVVGAVDGTSISVQLPSNQFAVADSTGRIAGNSTMQFTLDAQEVALIPSVFNQANATDFTGALITGDQPFSLFSSHVCTFAPSDIFACDHLQEQINPTTTWGSQYQLVPVAERGSNFPAEVVYWKILANEDGTVVQFGVPFDQLFSVGASTTTMPRCGNLIGADGNLTLNAGQFCEFGTKRATQIRSSKPVLVAGMLVGQSATYAPSIFDTPFGRRAGDPALFLQPADQQFRADYVFLTPDTYFVDYVTVITQPDNQIILNDAPLALDGATPVGGSEFVFKHVELNQDGPQKLSGARPFGIIVYAYDDFVSYAFTGGINLMKF